MTKFYRSGTINRLLLSLLFFSLAVIITSFLSLFLFNSIGGMVASIAAFLFLFNCDFQLVLIRFTRSLSITIFHQEILHLIIQLTFQNSLISAYLYFSLCFTPFVLDKLTATYRFQFELDYLFSFIILIIKIPVYALAFGGIINSFNNFIECLLWARQYFKYWGYNSE